jgi:hypothetical protein
MTFLPDTSSPGGKKQSAAEIKDISNGTSCDPTGQAENKTRVLPGEGILQMKKTTLRLLLIVMLFAACASTPVLADGGSGPSCRPPLNCVAR